MSEGSLFENALFNQLWEYGTLAYLNKRNDYEIDFILTHTDGKPVGLEGKLHPITMDDQRVKRIADKNELSQSWIVGKYPTPGFTDFIWGGSIF